MPHTTKAHVVVYKKRKKTFHAMRKTRKKEHNDDISSFGCEDGNQKLLGFHVFNL